MNTISPTYIFLDANSVLHFKRPDQIDWCKLTKAPAVVLLAAPILLRELELQKVHNKAPILRDRADRIVQWFGELLDSASTLAIRQSVTLEFIDQEPTVDFVQHRRQSSLSDDQLIGSILTFRNQMPDATIVVATADIGLRAKLKTRRISVLNVPEQCALSEPLDPNEQQVRELRIELERLKARIPKLRLAFGNGDGNHSFDLTLKTPAPAISTPSDVKGLYPLLPVFRGQPLSAEQQRTYQDITMRGWTPESIQQFNRGVLHDLYSRWEDYYELVVEWLKERQRTLEVTLSLHNQGTAVATNMDVILTFPDDLLLFDNMPQPPDPPSVPQNYPGRLSSQSPITVPRLRQFIGTGHGTPVIADQSVRFHVNELKHHHYCDLGKFVVVFETEESILASQPRPQLHL
jgi:hypothetical protein